MQFVFLVADDDGVPGVGPAVVAGDGVELRGEHVDDLALALVAPLQADDGGVAGPQAQSVDQGFVFGLKFRGRSAASGVSSVGRLGKAKRGSLPDEANYRRAWGGAATGINTICPLWAS